MEKPFETGRMNIRKSLLMLFMANDEFEQFVKECVKKHSNGEYGLACSHICKLNDENIENGLGIVTSIYRYEAGEDNFLIAIHTHLANKITNITPVEKDSEKLLLKE